MTTAHFHELQRDFRNAYTELMMGRLLTEDHHLTRDWSDSDTVLRVGQLSRALSCVGVFIRKWVEYLGRPGQFEPDMTRFEIELRMGQLVSMQYHGSVQDMSPADVQLKLGQVSRALSYLVRVLQHLQTVVPMNHLAQAEWHGVTRELRIAQSFSIGYRGSAESMFDRDVRRKILALSRCLWYVLRLIYNTVGHIPHSG